MPRSSYEPVLSAKAWEFFTALTRQRQQRLTKLIHLLADYPHRLGDYQTRDSVGRFLENLQMEGFVFTYWADGAVKELRILDIVEL